MEHSEKYLQAKWVTENPKGYDERDVARANSYCEAYLEGYNQALSIANVGSNEVKCCSCDYPIVRNDGNSDYCGNCGDDLE